MNNKVYAIVDVDIFDPEGYGEYMRLVSPALKSAGARYLVRGGSHKVLEGDWVPHRLVLVEFSSMGAARDFYSSPEYCNCKDIRLACGSSNVVLVPGVELVQPVRAPTRVSPAIPRATALAMPPIRKLPLPHGTSTANDFGRVSLVMMARMASSLP